MNKELLGTIEGFSAYASYVAGRSIHADVHGDAITLRDDHGATATMSVSTLESHSKGIADKFGRTNMLGSAISRAVNEMKL